MSKGPESGRKSGKRKSGKRAGDALISSSARSRISDRVNELADEYFGDE